MALVAQAPHRIKCEPLWRSFYGMVPLLPSSSSDRQASSAHHPYIDKASVAVAFHVSGMFDRVVGVEVPLATIRDLSRFLLLLRSLRATATLDNAAPPSDCGDDGAAVAAASASSSIVSRIRPDMMELPSPSFAGMLLPTLRRNAIIVQYVSSTFEMLCSGGGQQCGATPPGVRFPAFRAFLSSVLVAVCANAFRVPPSPTPGALNMSPRGTHVMRGASDLPSSPFVPPDTEIIDAVVLGEWRHQRTGSAKCLGLLEFAAWLLNTAMLLTTCTNHSKAVQNVVDLFEAVLVPLAEKQRQHSTTGGSGGVGGEVVDPDVEMPISMAGASTLQGQRQLTATKPCATRLSPRGTMGPHGRHSSKHHGLPNIRSTKGPAPDLNGTHKGLNDADSIEPMQAILGHSRDVSNELEAKLLHTGALRLMDGYPMKLRR